MSTDTVTLRSFETLRDFEVCVELQRETWGRDFSACVPAAVLRVAQKVGGVTAGAFDADGHLLGFVFGLTGYSRGRPLHWSHMLAVRESARDAGLGIKLKLYQRELLLEHGVETACWTFDPLVAKNAHINLNRLGAVVVEHVENMYGDSNSTLHAGLGTDRFVVEWRLGDKRVARAIAGLERPEVTPFATSPVVTDTLRQSPTPGSRVRIEIPADIYGVLERAPEEAAEWRVRTRGVLQAYLGKGYRVAAFFRERESGRCFYGLAPG
jgi:chorismate synthase